MGGQVQGEPFLDETWQQSSEIYSPKTNNWTAVAPHSTPRVYHSWALLLPDASAIVGGGGLDSSRPNTSHYDAQIYHPPYLFRSDGKALAKQPEFKLVSGPTYKIGETITITTDGPVDAVGSLIR